MSKMLNVKDLITVGIFAVILTVSIFIFGCKCSVYSQFIIINLRFPLLLSFIVSFYLQKSDVCVML